VATARARAPVTVGAVTGTVAGPAQVAAGESFKASWKGPDNPRNFITVVPKGAREGGYSSAYFYTTAQNNPGRLIAPLVPGDYELRYSTAEKYLTLARAALQVTPAKSEPGRVAVTMAVGSDSNGAIEIILDASGSMLQKLGGQRRIDIAKRTLSRLISSSIPAGTPFAFRVFGREEHSCQTDLDVPVAPLNRAAVGQRIAALSAKNGAKTPIGASLDKAADDLKAIKAEKLIVLVTDGEETCGGDPPAAIERLRKAGITTRVSIVGFALDDEILAATFRRWSDAGGGAFFDAKDAAGLDKSLSEALRAGFEVVNANGQVLASGIVGGEAVAVPAGNHTVRLAGRAAKASKPLVVKPSDGEHLVLEVPRRVALGSHVGGKGHAVVAGHRRSSCFRAAADEASNDPHPRNTIPTPSRLARGRSPRRSRLAGSPFPKSTHRRSLDVCPLACQRVRAVGTFLRVVAR
jgi:Mg-chelatase subunit ChlD